ncbi:MAG: glycogen debranching enzyme family protein [Bacteroidales bacterium]|nr:glycogen debranching enzyme family protein [Candidatus Cacconaster merdequi]
MAYLKFNKAELVNLEYSLKRELLATNRAGGYLNTTIVCCNTRKYHCLFSVPIGKFGGHRYILLSAADETLLQHGKAFNLGIHCYGDIYEPRGHKYIVDFEMAPVPTVTYRVGGMLFKKEMLFVAKSEQLLIRYTLLENAETKTLFQIKPFLAFRSIHSLTKANGGADTHFTPVSQGAGYCMYRDFPMLYIQFSKQNDYVHSPDWYRDVVYTEEYRRGFDCTEDLLVPGFFEMPLRKGESVVMSVSTKVENPATLKAQFTRGLKAIGNREDFDGCLRAAASQLIAYEDPYTRICTGFSWHEIGGLRETLIAIAGLTIFNTGDVKLFTKILDDLITENRAFLFEGCDQTEAPLRLAEAIQNLASFTSDEENVWKKYGSTMCSIVESYLSGRPGVTLRDNGLVWSEKEGVATSWMNSYVDSRPVNERKGFQVETNCLWYNAVCLVEKMEGKFGKNASLVERCSAIRKKIDECFLPLFWVDARRHLADYVGTEGQNVFTRPNQIYACSLEYSPVPEEVKAEILHAVSRELLTTRGIRTLSPKNPLYRSRYEGNQYDRDMATHNGCTRPWLLGPYVEAQFKLYGGAFSRKARTLIDYFQEDMNVHGIGAVAEIYDGDPPYMPHGAINSALSVAAILKVEYLIEKYKED